MKDYSRYIISYDRTVKETIIALNNLSGDVLNLFVVNCENQLVGTVTDGDIRRSIISDIELSEKVSHVMHRDFVSLPVDKIDVLRIKEYKNDGICLLPIVNADRNIVDIYNLQNRKSILPIDAVLMAGGKGERLRPLTEKTPKPLLKIGDKSIIDYNVDNLIDYGVENINVTVNYLGKQLEEHFENKKRGIKINCFREPRFLGTMGSIKFVDTFQNDTILVMNSDLFTNINFEDFYLHFIKNDADLSVAAVPYTVNVPYGIFDLEDRNIKGVKEKPTYNYYANSGIYLMKKEMLDFIPNEEFFNATDFIDRLIEKNKKVIRFPLVGYWIDIGKPVDFQKAQDFVKHL